MFWIVFVNCSMLFRVFVQPDVNPRCCFFGGSLESTAQLSSFSLRRNPYSRALGSQALGWWLQCRDYDAFGKSLITILTNCTRRLGGWKPCMHHYKRWINDDDVDVVVDVVVWCCWCMLLQGCMMHHDEPCFCWDSFCRYFMVFLWCFLIFCWNLRRRVVLEAK